MSPLAILEAATSQFHGVSNGWDALNCKSRNVAHAAALLELLLEVLPLPLSKSLMQKAFRFGGEGRNRRLSPRVFGTLIGELPINTGELVQNCPCTTLELFCWQFCWHFARAFLSDKSAGGRKKFLSFIVMNESYQTKALKRFQP
jgi:hypothetical protein